jgi:transposase InsO family protein
VRHQLAQDGHDCGAATIAYHLAKRIEAVPSKATIWRILKREGLIVPQPQKRPRSSLIRFEADLPNETWQTDITHWQLAAGEHAEILNFIDDHSRLFLVSDAYPTTKAQDVVDSFHKAASLHGLPASLLSDNGAVFTASPRHGKVLLQSELQRLGITSKNSRPYHPQTCGKIERLHQTPKRYLAKQPPADGLTELQAQLDTFVHYYNDIPPTEPSTGAPATGLQHPHQGQTHRPGSQSPLPGPPRQGRRHQQRQPALPQQALQNRPRQSPQTPHNQAPHRRPTHPRHRPPRTTHPRAHTRPNPQLPTPHAHLTRLPSPETSLSQCPATQQYGSDGGRTLVRHHIEIRSPRNALRPS